MSMIPAAHNKARNKVEFWEELVSQGGSQERVVNLAHTVNYSYLNVDRLATQLIAISFPIALDLSNNLLRPEDFQKISQALVKNPKLTQLKIGGNRLGDRGVGYIQDIVRANPNVAVLDISNNQITKGGLERLLQVDGMLNTISDIDLSENSMSSTDALLLFEYFSHSATIRSIKLSGCGLDDHVVTALSCSTILINSTLEQLDLSNNRLSRKCMTEFVELLQYAARLRSLNLSSNHIDDDGIAVFAKLLSVSTSLQYLCLNGNPFYDRGVKAIMNGLESNYSLIQVGLRLIGSQSIFGAMFFNPTIDVKRITEILARNKKLIGTFHDFARQGDIAHLTELATAHPSLLSSREEQTGNTVLHWPEVSQHESRKQAVVDLMYDAGIPTNALEHCTNKQGQAISTQQSDSTEAQGFLFTSS